MDHKQDTNVTSHLLKTTRSVNNVLGLAICAMKMTVNASLVWKCMSQLLVGEELKQKT